MVVLTPKRSKVHFSFIPWTSFMTLRTRNDLGAMNNFWKTLVLALKVPSLLLGRGHNCSSQVNLFLLVFKIKLRKRLVFNKIYFFPLNPQVFLIILNPVFKIP